MASSLGKRKERDGEDTPVVTHGSTLFVSNLPYNATSTDLQTLFSDLAPVRSAFVVLAHGSGVSKGVGYVSFAVKEDAQSAYDKINAEGIVLDGRILRVQWAEYKSKDKTQKEKSEKKQPRPSVPRPHPNPASHDPLAIRTVVIGGLPASIDSKTLWKKIRKLEGAEKVEWPITSDAGVGGHSVAHALFTTPATASEAVNKLHAHVFKGSLLSVTLKKRLDSLAKTSRKPKKAATAPPNEATPSRASRLIVRNIPWDIKEQDLRAIFLPFGPIHSIDIPRVAVCAKEDVKSEGGDEKTSRIKGFAFVWMLSRKDAEKAMEGCNGMTIQAGMAERMVSDKHKKKKQKREELKRQQAPKTEDGEEGYEEEEGAAQGRAQRVIAVDWALSKDQWEMAKAKMEAEGEGDNDVEMAEASHDAGSENDGGQSGSESDGEQTGSDDEDEHLGVHQDGEEGSDDESDDGSRIDGDSDGEDEQEPAKPTLPPPESGMTLFVRNIPFEATDDELRVLFRAFGPLRYARIAMDPESGRSRGTGFVCFWNKMDADKAIAQSEILRSETVGDKAAAPKKNPFKLPSLLTPDPSASMAQNLVLHGRTLDAILAVTRDEAGKLKEAGERQREKADKRNLYLLREGIILPNTPAAESLGQTELEKRTQSYNSRRALLRSNPSLYVSRTRLSVRQLPIFASERMLKRLAVHAVRTFEKEANEGVRQKLTDDELLKPNHTEDPDADGEIKEEEHEEQNKKRGKSKGGRDTGVIQAKIVRQQDRVDPVTGKGRSKGYGFLEMAKHADALRVLRWANNNPSVGSLFEEWWKGELKDLLNAEKKKEKMDEARVKRVKEEFERSAKSKSTLIVEFSIENVQVVQRRAAQQREKQQSSGGPTKRLRRLSLPEVKTEPQADKLDERSAKKSRILDPQLSSEKMSKHKTIVKSGQKVGSMIGRKRKERKLKKAGGSR
ncbi:hypothetical protein BKA93DRAFT_536324 [Sparassis latifolia]